jgi:hypothetical protein
MLARMFAGDMPNRVDAKVRASGRGRAAAFSLRGLRGACVYFLFVFLRAFF